MATDWKRVGVSAFWIVVSIAVLGIYLFGCGTLTLRPVNPDHHARKIEVSERLGVDEQHVDAALAADQAVCDKLDNEVTGFTGTTVVLGVLGGAGGLASLWTEQTPRYAIQGTSVGLAALSALFAYLSTQFAQRYARRCAINTGGR